MRFFILFIFCALPLFGLSQDSLLNHYKIYSTSRQKTITTDELVKGMANADVLFFGEEHNDSTDHVLEHEIFKQLTDKYPGKTALAMEMFESDCQIVLDEYLAGLIREKNFISEGRAWPNYKDYRPLVELAKANHIPVIAANAPDRYVNMVNRTGLASLQQLGKTAKAWLPPLPIDTATGAYYDKFVQIMGGRHASMGGMQMYQAQNLWDATMGWNIARFYKKHRGYKVLQLNGGFHSDEKLGAAAKLNRYAPKARIINIACTSDGDFNDPDWSKYSKNNDYIILTAPIASKQPQ